MFIALIAQAGGQGATSSWLQFMPFVLIIVIMYMRPGEPETHSETWLDTTVMVTSILTVMLGLLPGPLLALAGQAELFTWLP